ncbi:MAG: AI-2E family transporter, partial [Clostridia bacterium]|nr:AI-2E family transporter [Clostridia bacterium]
MVKEQIKKYLVPGVMLLVLYLVIRYWSFVETAVLTFLTAASPLIIGGAVAYLLGILMSRYERWWFPKTKKKFLIRSRRAFCLVFAILTLLAIVVLVVLLVIPQLWDAIALLLAELPGAMQKVLAFAESLEILPEDILAMLESIDWKSQITGIFKTLFTGVGSVVNVAVSVVTAVFSSVFNGLLAVIFALYLLLGKEKLKSQGDRLLVRYMKPAITKKLEYLLTVLDDCFHKFIVGQCLEALILGVLCTLGMLI